MAIDYMVSAATWDTIRLAWSDSDLPLTRFHDTFGLPQGFIERRAKRENWPARPKRGEGRPWKLLQPEASPAGEPPTATSEATSPALSKRNRPARKPARKTTPRKPAVARSPSPSPAASKTQDASAIPAPSDPVSAPPAMTQSELAAKLDRLFEKLLDAPDDEAIGQLGRMVSIRACRTLCLKLDHLEARMNDGTIVSPAESERHTKECSTAVSALEKAFDIMPGAARSATPAKRPAEPQIKSPADIERIRLEIADRLERIRARQDAERGDGAAGGDRKSGG